MTDSSKTTQQSQSSTTNPYAPAQPLVNSLISQYGSLNPGLTANQGGALTNLNNSVSNLPNFGDTATSGVNSIFGNANSAPQVGMLNNAYSTLQGNLGATASGANLDPYSTPGFGDALKTAMDDITNRTKGVYAASGRDPSGAGSFAQSLGRGLTQGVAPTIAGQYNTNYGNMVNANNSLFSGAGNTASAINNLRSGDTATMLAGLQGAGAIPGLYSQPATAQLGAANAQYGQQFQNLAQLLQPSVALAGLGSNSTGTGNSTQTNYPSWMSNIGTGISAAGTIAGMFSDARLKTDIEKVGKLNDGQNIYSYRYRGSNVPQIGLLAQEVERVHPEAVGEVAGFKTVRYDLATRRARVGALREAA
jgi:hypothetical protein